LPEAEIFVTKHDEIMLNYGTKLLKNGCKNAILFSVKWLKILMLITSDREMILT